MRVLFIPSWYSSDDRRHSGIFFRDQAVALARTGLKVGIIYAEERSLRGFRLAGLKASHFQTTERTDSEVQTIRSHGWNLKPNALAEHIWRLRTRRLLDRYIKRYGKPDIIHAQGILWAGVVARLALRQLEIPFVVTEHSSNFLREVPPNHAPIIRSVLADASRAFAVSSALANALTPFTARRIEVLPNVVDTDYFVAPRTRGAQVPFVFLSVANLVDVKGLDVLLKAFTRAAFDYNVRLDVGGDGPLRPKLERLAVDLGIGRQVRFLGRLSRDEVRAAMWSADAFVLSSRAETFGVVLIEALATGLPVVSTSCGGPSDIVTPERGILVPPNDCESLANALREMHRDSHKFDRDNLSTSTKLEFGAQRFTDRLIAAYGSVIAGTAPCEHSP